MRLIPSLKLTGLVTVLKALKASNIDGSAATAADVVAGFAAAEPTEAPDDSDCSCCGTADINRDRVDCDCDAAEEPAAWVTAAAWPDCPAGFVVSGGWLNGVSSVAVDEEAA